jgi:hypothetical protein
LTFAFARGAAVEPFAASHLSGRPLRPSGRNTDIAAGSADVSKPKPAVASVKALQDNSAAPAIARWVADLDGQRFAVRQEASRHLRQGGWAVVGPLADAAAAGPAEVARRAVEILDDLCWSTDAQVETSAQAALQRLAASPRPSVSQPAVAALRVGGPRRAMAAIRRLGGEVTEGGVEEGNCMFFEVAFAKQWRGGDAGLEHLPRLGHVQHLLFFGLDFTDASLDQLKGLVGVQSVRLYATQVTDDGEARLRTMFPSATIDRRKGAMLGVSGWTDPRGCRVVMVVANGAAELAGIEVDDIITRIGQTPVRDLQGMIRAISRYQAGDRARVEFLRGSETLFRDVVFGEMALDLLR